MPDDLETYWRSVRPRPGGRGRASWLKGEIFGRLRVIERAGSNKHGASLWRCVCACGTEKTVARGPLVDGRVKSCGCLAKEYKHSQKPHLTRAVGEVCSECGAAAHEEHEEGCPVQAEAPMDFEDMLGSG